MPRYFFNIFDGKDAPDQDGTELADMYVVQSQAIRMSGEILREMGAQFWDGTEWRLEVSNEQGTVLFVLRISAEERPVTDPTNVTLP